MALTRPMSPGNLRAMRPATAISMLALFIALSGTAVALPGKNRVDRNDAKRGSIGTRAIANNSIRSQDIRTGNVRSSDINDGAVTGTDVDEGSLGQVPSAASAGSATTATTATTAGTASNAGLLDGIDSTGFLRNNLSRVRSVADSGGDADYGNNAALATLSNLAGGSYSVTAKLTINNDGASPENVTCQLISQPGQTVLDTSLQTLGALGGAAQQLQFSFVAEVSMSGSGTGDLVVRCTNAAGDNDADDVRLVAHKEN